MVMQEPSDTSTETSSASATDGAAAFSPAVQSRIDAFLARVRDGEFEQPTAVFDFDGTICRDDVGERFLRWLIEHRKLQGVDYASDIYGDYEATLQRDHALGYSHTVALMRGIREDELRAWCGEFGRTHTESLVFSRQLGLIRELRAAGVDVWIVSASCEWLIVAVAPHIGVEIDRGVGVRSEVVDGVLTDRIIPPVTYRAGKVQAIQERIGRDVHFAAGNAMTDLEMLQAASGLSLVINPSDELRGHCVEHGWAVQEWT